MRFHRHEYSIRKSAGQGSRKIPVIGFVEFLAKIVEASHDVIPLLTGGQDQPPGRLCIVEQTVDSGAW
jgi:hypothetical protein